MQPTIKKYRVCIGASELASTGKSGAKKGDSTVHSVTYNVKSNECIAGNG